MERIQLVLWAAFYAVCVVFLFGVGITLFSPELNILREEGKGDFLNFNIPALMILLILLLTYRRARMEKSASQPN